MKQISKWTYNILIQGHINCSDALKYEKASACAGYLFTITSSKEKKNSFALGKINEQTTSVVKRGTKNNR